jgi:hypothetical protein
MRQQARRLLCTFVGGVHFDLPILAAAATSVPYTLGEAGVLYHRPDYAVLAETLQLLLTDLHCASSSLPGNAGDWKHLRRHASRQPCGMLCALLEYRWGLPWQRVNWLLWFSGMAKTLWAVSESLWPFCGRDVCRRIGTSKC